MSPPTHLIPPYGGTHSHPTTSSPQLSYILSFPSDMLHLILHLAELSYTKPFPTPRTDVVSCSSSHALESCLVLSFTWKSSGIAMAFNLIIFNNCSERFSFIFVMLNQPDVAGGVLQPC